MAGLDRTLMALSRRYGVTRLARLTGLDRCGLEVYAAVRPRGHVLQVSQGKGRTRAAARWSALGEAVELAVAEQVDPSLLVFREAGPTEQGWTVGEERVAWLPARRLRDGATRWVPAQEVLCPPAGGGAWLGPVSAAWKSNGLGFHPASRARALEHAGCEVLERDALARVLPHGWTPAAALARLVAPRALGAGLAARGFACFLFDLSAGPLPVAGALLFDLEGGPVPLTAGYAARRTFAAAADAAVLEAAQSRLTEIHGSREDVVLGQREAGQALLRALRGVTPTRRPPGPFRRPLHRASRHELLAVTLSRAPWVVKVVSPTLLVSELL